MSGFWGRNWLGVLAIALAAMSFASFIAAAVLISYTSLHPAASAVSSARISYATQDNPIGLVGAGWPIAAAASTLTGVAAVLRARRGRGSLAMAIGGLVAGAVQTALYAIWILFFILTPGGGGD